MALLLDQRKLHGLRDVERLTMRNFKHFPSPMLLWGKSAVVAVGCHCRSLWYVSRVHRLDVRLESRDFCVVGLWK